MPLYKSGQLNALAVTSRQRYKPAAEVPTMDEAGLPGDDVVLWQGIFAPAGTDARIVQKIGTDVARIFQEPENVARLDAIGLGQFLATPDAFKLFCDVWYAKWAQVIKAAGIRAR